MLACHSGSPASVVALLSMATRRMRSACCAWATSGHIAAPPTNAINSRRLMLTLSRRHSNNITWGIGEAHECPLWVKSRHRSTASQCPLYPRKRTLVERVVMSALCQKQTYAAQQNALFDHTTPALMTRVCGKVRLSAIHRLSRSGLGLESHRVLRDLRHGRRAYRTRS